MADVSLTDRGDVTDLLAELVAMPASQILSSRDIETIRDNMRKGLGDNSARAIASDLYYLEHWHRASLGGPLPWPAPEELVAKFVAHHLYDADARRSGAQIGMPDDVREVLEGCGVLKVDGPHAVSTIRRRLAHWRLLHRWRGITGPFGSELLKMQLRNSARAVKKLAGRKSARAVTLGVLNQVLETCAAYKMIDIRDRAILLTTFGSGGRRRSEIADLDVSQVVRHEPVRKVDGDFSSPLLSLVEIRLGKTKTTIAGDDASVFVRGRAADALIHWIEVARIESGRVFRAVDRFGKVSAKGISAQSVNLMLKARVAKAGLDPSFYSAHGLRSGFMTEAADQGVPLLTAMQQSQHRSVQIASRYYNKGAMRKDKAAGIAG